VDSRTSEAAEAVAERRDSRRREGRDGRETAAEEEGHEGRRRGGRWGREVESAVGVAMEARQLLCVGGALSFLLSWFPNGNLVERVSTARSASSIYSCTVHQVRHGEIALECFSSVKLNALQICLNVNLLAKLFQLSSIYKMCIS
jgi:hypothetical protein